MFSTINKQIDFEKELLASKTLQLLIGILDRLHQGKCGPLLQLYEKPHHIRALIQGCFVLINSFLMKANEKQESKYKEQLAKLTSQNNNECTPAVMSQVHGLLQSQPFDINVLTSSLSFVHRLLQANPKRFLDLAKSNLFAQTLKQGLIEISQRRVQEKIQIFYLQLVARVEPQLTKEGLPADCLPSYVLLSIAFKEFIPLSTEVENTQKMRTFFKLVTEIINGSSNVSSFMAEIIKPADLIEGLIRIIQERKIKEATSRDEDVVLAGLFDTLGLVLLAFPDVRRGLPDRAQFIHFLTHRGLFEKETRLIAQ